MDNNGGGLEICFLTGNHQNVALAVATIKFTATNLDTETC